MTIIEPEMTVEGKTFDGDALIHLTNPFCAANKKGADSCLSLAEVPPRTRSET